MTSKTLTTLTVPTLLLAAACGSDGSTADPAGAMNDQKAATMASASNGNTQTNTGESSFAEGTSDDFAGDGEQGAPVLGGAQTQPSNGAEQQAFMAAGGASSGTISVAAAGASGAAAPGVADAERIAAEPEPAVDEDTAVEEQGAEEEPPTFTTNPYVDVSYDPMSTFAVDVDTASYDIFRRDVTNGRLPTPETVRLEEFVNFFDYDYPAPEADAEEPFSISLAAAPNLIDNGTTLLRVGIQGELPPEFEKKPANLVFLIDVSGSMQSAEKLPLVQSVLNQTVGILEPEDTVSIVTYASGTGVQLEPTAVSDAETIRAEINGLSAGGSTNGAGGIQLAYEQARNGSLKAASTT